MTQRVVRFLTHPIHHKDKHLHTRHLSITKVHLSISKVLGNKTRIGEKTIMLIFFFLLNPRRSLRRDGGTASTRVLENCGAWCLPPLRSKALPSWRRQRYFRWQLTISRCCMPKVGSIRIVRTHKCTFRLRHLGMQHGTYYTIVT